MKTYRSLDLPSIPAPCVGRDTGPVPVGAVHPRPPRLRQARTALALLSVLALPARVLAEPKARAKAVDADVAAAEALFEQGRALMKQGRPQEACPKFWESQRLEPGLGTQFNLASCLEQLGKLASAHALFTEVADAAAATGQEERERVARARADAVAPQLTRLAILVPAGSSPELRVMLDGVRLKETEWSSPVPIDPGVHRVRASGPGLSDWSTDIDIPSDGSVHQVLIPADAESSFFTPLNHKLALAAVGVAVVGFGAASYFTVHALSQKEDADATGCQGKQCPTQQGVDLRHQASSAGNLATVSVGIGVAGLAAAAALLWIVPKSESSHVEESATLELTPVVAPGVGALLIGAGF